MHLECNLKEIFLSRTLKYRLAISEAMSTPSLGRLDCNRPPLSEEKGQVQHMALKLAGRKRYLEWHNFTV